jgi:hypothetical protein
MSTSKSIFHSESILGIDAYTVKKFKRFSRPQPGCH